MLMSLSIRNVALIKRLEISFASGLSVLTGETGAGKSILLDALGLALGARSESNLLRRGSDHASVVAEFSTQPHNATVRLLKEQNLEHDEIILLRLVLGVNGRTRAFVNDQPVSVSFLRRVGESLVEIQGQFGERDLIAQKTHQNILDNFGNYQSEFEATKASFMSLKNANKELSEAEDTVRKANQDAEYIRHATNELVTLNPIQGEDADLIKRRQILMNAEKMTLAINEAFAVLEGENGAENSLRKALVSLERVAKTTGDLLVTATTIIERALIDTEEAIISLRDTASTIELDSRCLEEIEDRLHALRDIARKHRIKIDELPKFKETLETKLLLIDDQSNKLATLRNAMDIARKNFIYNANALRQKRVTAANYLDQSVNRELESLKLEKASFNTLIDELPEDQWNETGMDRVSFQVSTNPSTPAGPLSKIASGGELSRFMLALRVVIAAEGGPDTLIFDEVDSGVGGATADAVGTRLALLSQKLQVLVVTHSPQVAARGNSHFKVEKLSNSEETITDIQKLLDNEKCEEVARMLAGREITEEARAAANKLIQGKDA